MLFTRLSTTPTRLSSTATTLRSLTAAARAPPLASAAVAQRRCMGAVHHSRQKTLNKYLGLPLEQIQTRVDSLFRKQDRLLLLSANQSRVASSSAATSASSAMQIDDTQSSDVEEVKTAAASSSLSKAAKGSNGAASKKRRVEESSDEEGNDAAAEAGDDSKPVTNGTSTKKSKTPEPEKKKAKKADDKDKPSKSTTTAKPKKEETKKMASIFAPPKKAAEKKETSSTSASKTADKGKKKAAAQDEEEEGDDAGVDKSKKAAAAAAAGSDAEVSEGVPDKNAEEEEDMESEEEEEQASRLAEIFTKKVAGSSKGKYGKALEWKAGEPVPYAALAEVFERIDSTTKRLEIAAYLTDFLQSVIERTPNDLIKIVYLCINRICPDYEGLELGIGEGMIKKAIASATGKDTSHINAEYKKVGDLGLVAMNSRASQKTLFKPKPLTVVHVFNKLKEIAQTSGNKSQDRKVGIVNGLLAACQGQEAKFIVRSLEGKLRIGLAEQTVLGALAGAIVGARHASSGKSISRDRIAKDLEEGSRIVKSVFSECPSYDMVIPPLLEGGPEKLRETIKLTPGIPLKPMLAKPTKAITEVLDRFEGKKFTCEYKYDGERAQVHYYDGKLSVFSRNSEDMSVKYPDLIEHMQKAIKEETKSFVLDAEAVAWDKEEGKILPFQELSKRKRKDVKAEDIKVKVHIFAFDLLYVNGEMLLQKDLSYRRELLRKYFIPVEGQFAIAKSSDAHAVEEIQTFLDESIKDSCEGLMVKMLEGEDAYYEPSRRSMNWLKLKKDYLAGVGDSFDLVVIGGYFGRGKRTSVYGAFLLACWDPESETYQAITKIGTGFSEEMLETHYKYLQPLECKQKKGYYDVGTAAPDVYFEPKQLWEVLAADLSLSPVYSAAKGLIEARGISLRFPRFLRIRDDKDPEDASSAEFVAEAYQRQAAASGNAKGKKGKGNADADDFW